MRRARLHDGGPSHTRPLTRPRAIRMFPGDSGAPRTSDGTSDTPVSFTGAYALARTALVIVRRRADTEVMKLATLIATGATIVTATAAAAVGGGGGGSAPAAVTVLSLRGPADSGEVRHPTVEAEPGAHTACPARHAPQPNPAGELTPLAPTGERNASVYIVFDSEGADGCAA